MKFVHYKANTRGYSNHGWLEVNHMFSFAGYYNPERVHFGALRVLNDDIIQGGTGFPTHPHDNMEIITVPLYGVLSHKDSMGFEGSIEKGEVQVMSAGTGIYHSEYNGSASDPANICQIWIFPNKRDVEPRYDKISFSLERNQLQQLVSPDSEDEGSWIHSDSWISHGEFDEGNSLNYKFKKPGNGLFVFLIEGEVSVDDILIEKRDGIGFYETAEIPFKFIENSRILLLEIPMEIVI